MSTTITVNGHVDQDSKPEQKKKWLHDSGRAGYPQSPDYDSSTSRLNPDEMFVKHPVTEIGAIRQKLRADADAKQEDLRSMVGVENVIGMFFTHHPQLFQLHDHPNV